MSISRFLSAILAVALVLSPARASTSASTLAGWGELGQPKQRSPDVSCEACIVVADTGEVLFRRRIDQELPNASTTKMMTAVLVARAGVTGETVTISPTAAATGGAGPALEEGDEWPAESLLYALLLASSNDAAVALAEHVSGSTAAFVEDMNEEAAALGLDHTRFATPHGLDTPGHFSSPRDLVTIAEVLLDDPVLKAIVADTEERVEGPRGEVLVENRNLLLDSYPGATGVKTGYTLGAGNALVSAARRGGRTLIAVVLRAEDPFADSTALLDHGFAELGRSVLLGRGAEVGTVVLDPAGSVTAVMPRVARGLAPLGEIEVSFVPLDDFTLPVQAGDVVGQVTVTWRERVVERMDAVAGNELQTAGVSWIERGLATVLSWGQRMTGGSE